MLEAAIVALQPIAKFMELLREFTDGPLVRKDG